MKRKRVIIALVLVFIGALAVSLCRNREPRFQGRTLSQWISLFEHSEPFDPNRQAAGDAIRHMGPEAIPCLLSWVQIGNSPFISKVRIWMAIHPTPLFKVHSPSYYHYRAFLGFEILRQDAKPAWPALVKMTCSPDSESRSTGLVALQLTHPDRETFLPVLLRLIKDSDTDVQYRAMGALSAYYPEDAEAVGIYSSSFPFTNRPPGRTMPPVK